MACSAVLQELRKAVTEQQPASTMTALVQRLQEALVQTGDPAEAIGSLFAHLEAVKAVSGAVQVVAAFLRAQTANGATNTTAQLLLGILGQPLAAPVQNTSTGAGESVRCFSWCSSFFVDMRAPIRLQPRVQITTSAATTATRFLDFFLFSVCQLWS